MSVGVSMVELAALPDVFRTPEALAINRARMEHLQSLDLFKAGDRVLDVGCGPGLLARYLIDWGCKVVGVDGRKDNTKHCPEEMRVVIKDVMTQRLPRNLGKIDAVFCYGLLYHLSDPEAGLRFLASAKAPLVVVETIVTDSGKDDSFTQPGFRGANQSLDGQDSYPPTTWLADAFGRVGYPYTYIPDTKPAHPDYQWVPEHDDQHQRDGHDLRVVMVARSKIPENTPKERAPVKIEAKADVDPKSSTHNRSPVRRRPGQGRSPQS